MNTYTLLPALLSSGLAICQVQLPDLHGREASSSRQKLENASRVFAEGAGAVGSGDVVRCMLSVSHYLTIPASINETLRAKLTDAEDAFWADRSRGVDESDLVRAFNRLAAELDLPAFARTSEDQVRFLRMQTIARSPVFMGRGAVDPRSQVGRSITRTMSPAQALHLTLTLIDQKFYNPTFQVPPDEWPRSRAEYESALVSAPPGLGASAAVRALPTQKLLELNQRLNASTAELSYGEAIRLISEFQSILGLN